MLALLDSISLPVEGSTDKILETMICFSDGCLVLLSALNPQSRLLEHPKLLKIIGALDLLKDPLQRCQLPVDFLLRLKDKEIDLLAKFCAMASPVVSSLD